MSQYTPSRWTLSSQSLNRGDQAHPLPTEFVGEAVQGPMHVVKQSSEGAKSQRQRPDSKSKPTSLLEGLNPPIPSPSAPYPPILASSTISSGLLKRISPRKRLRPLKVSRAPKVTTLISLSTMPLFWLESSRARTWCRVFSYPIQPQRGPDITQRTQTPRMQRRGRRSGIGPLSMRISSPGRAPQQSFNQNLSQAAVLQAQVLVEGLLRCSSSCGDPVDIIKWLTRECLVGGGGGMLRNEGSDGGQSNWP